MKKLKSSNENEMVYEFLKTDESERTDTLAKKNKNTKTDISGSTRESHSRAADNQCA